MHPILRCAALAALALPQVLAAQTQVFMISPKDAATQGNTNNNIPYSWYTTRYQQIYDAGSFDVGTPTALNAVYYRMASGFGTGNYGGHTIELAVDMSMAASGISATSPSSTFANNLDTTTTKQVIAKTKLVMPKLSTYNWDIKLPFDSATTFLYGGLLNKNLVIETRVYNSSAITTYPLDAWALYGTSTQTGSYAGCKSSNASGSTVQHYSIINYLVVGNQNNYHYGYAYVPSIPAVMSLGGTALNLPLPGTTCYIANDLLLLVPGSTDTSSNGRFQVNLPIPNDSTLGGITYMTQMYFFDANANSLGITSTKSLSNTIAKIPAGSVTRLYATDSTGTADPGTFATASIGTNYGLVTRLGN
ncbi:MAG: hypothetical protein R3F30_03090 [Planctomycetota bacterium]